MGVLDGDSPVALPLPRFMIQIIYVVLLSRILGFFCHKLKQPMVVAEMIAGILLGPSAFGHIPGFSQTFFPKESVVILNVLANVGLIFFMFLVGMELDPDILRQKFKSSVTISTIGVIVPFAASIPVSYLLFTPEYALDSSFGNFLLFLGVAMGVSALPVLARILAERRMLQNQLGVVTMAATAIDDLEGWLLLAIVVSVARASSKLNILYTFLLCIANIVALIFVVRPIMRKIADRVEAHHTVTQAHFFIVFLLLFLFSWITDTIGLSAIFGAFEVGCVVPRKSRLIPELSEKLEDLVIVVFMPLFFTNSGLKTEFGLMDDARTWGLFILIFVVAFVSKVVGCAAAARWISKLSPKESVCFGILMQTKGLVALVVFNLGLEYKVISPKLFSINVLMVLISTIFTTPLVEWIYPVSQMREEALSAKGQESIYSILVCSSNPKTGRSLISIAEALVQGFEDKFGYRITGLTLIEDTEKPSTYMNALVHKAMHKRNPNLSSLRTRAKAVGIKVETMAYMKGDPGKDICTVSHARKAHLILMGATHHQNFDSSIIRHVVENSNTDVGILIDRGLEKRITRVLCPVAHGLSSSPSLSSAEYINVIMDYAAKMAASPAVHVTVMRIVDHSHPDDVNESNRLAEICGANSSMKFVTRQSEDIPITIAEETASGKYSLLIVPAPIPAEFEDSILKTTHCSLLAIYPSKFRVEIFDTIENNNNNNNNNSTTTNNKNNEFSGLEESGGVNMQI